MVVEMEIQRWKISQSHALHTKLFIPMEYHFQGCRITSIDRIRVHHALHNVPLVLDKVCIVLLRSPIGKVATKGQKVRIHYCALGASLRPDRQQACESVRVKLIICSIVVFVFSSLS